MLKKHFYNAMEGGIVCGNCGERGHNNKQCRKPIQSYGVILYREIDKRREYLMICNKDSYGYLQFLRGRYARYDLGYIRNLFSEMTTIELEKLETMTFIDLWADLWLEDKYKLLSYQSRDREFAEIKFNMMVEGYDIFGKIVKMKDLIDEYKHKSWNEPEWGFPKGRRSVKETNIECALREFKEETLISFDDIEIDKKFSFISEVFKGSDNIMYEHSYILAKYVGDVEPEIDKGNRKQMSEISQMRFLGLEECIEKIRPTMDWRKKIIRDVDKYIDESEDEIGSDPGSEEIVNSEELIDF